MWRRIDPLSLRRVRVQLGRPVHIQSFGAISHKRFYRHITPQEHWCAVLVNIEALLAEILPAASLAAGRPIRQTLVIVDLKGFGLSQFWAFKSIARRFFDVSQNYFPETYVPSPPLLACESASSFRASDLTPSCRYCNCRMGQLIIINAPTSFTAIWSMMKPWLAPRTLDKITILGTNNPEQHAARLLDLVPSENLPAALGGTCTCTYGASVATSSSSSSSNSNSSNRGDDDSDSSSSGDSDGESGGSGGGGGGGGGCVLSNAGPWMDGRAERRTRWLRGEIPSPGVPWPPPPPQNAQTQVPESARGAAAGASGAKEEEQATREESEEDGASQTAAAPVSGARSAGAGAGASSASSSSASTPSPSCGRASVVGLPLPLPHQPPPAAVPLVV